jgi:sensor histidine kinase regulating citrate/malate metabolism
MELTTIPRRPTGFGIFDEQKKMIGVVSVEELRSALNRFDEMEKFYKGRVKA